jgi:hypothetical protein
MLGTFMGGFMGGQGASLAPQGGKSANGDLYSPFTAGDQIVSFGGDATKATPTGQAINSLAQAAATMMTPINVALTVAAIVVGGLAWKRFS